MTEQSEPTRCPECKAGIPPGAQACPYCRVDVARAGAQGRAALRTRGRLLRRGYGTGGMRSPRRPPRSWTVMSIVGGVLLVLASLASGLGGLVIATMADPDVMIEMRKQNAASRPGGPTLQDEIDIAEMERAAASQTVKDYVAGARFYGFFEMFAAAFGLAGAVGMFLATRTGKWLGITAAMLGVLTCGWGIVSIGMGFFIMLQFVFMVPYLVALVGALSIKPLPKPGTKASGGLGAG